MTTTTIRQFCAALRKDGFDFVFRDRSGGCTVTQFAKRKDDRELHVQLWADGNCRVSHGTFSKINGRDCLRETTTPTDFKTLREMQLAIDYEWIRPSTVKL